jgi:amino acid permease
MAVDRICPSCNADEIKSLSDVLRQEAAAGVVTELAKRFAPPSQPWGYLQGFLIAVPVNVGLIMALGSPGEEGGDKAMVDLFSTVVFLGVWVGYGIWKNKTQKKKLEEWKNDVAAKLHCGKCSHVFQGQA